MKIFILTLLTYSALLAAELPQSAKAALDVLNKDLTAMQADFDKKVEARKAKTADTLASVSWDTKDVETRHLIDSEILKLRPIANVWAGILAKTWTTRWDVITFDTQNKMVILSNAGKYGYTLEGNVLTINNPHQDAFDISTLKEGVINGSNNSGLKYTANIK